MTKGVCFFAYNNDQIDYVNIAAYAASKVKQHLGVDVCLITDEGSWGWLNQNYTSDQLKQYFSDVVITDDEHDKNTRVHYDSPWTEYKAQFNNSNKHKIWEYSPYDQTILLDIDYILKTDYLSHCWDNYHGVAMFDEATSLRNNDPHSNERMLFPFGIKMWWSTVVYFDRSESSKAFFDTWAHVKDNYDFYQYLYHFPGTMFRTDYCVSIAAHILNGMNEGQEVNEIPSKMQNLSGKDDILDHSGDTWICLSHDPKEPWKNLLVRHENLDVHCMNKRALTRLIEREKQ